MSHQSWLDSAEVFCAQASASAARIEARLALDASLGSEFPAAELQLAGQIRGPICVYARTLPEVAPLRPAEGPPGVLAAACTLANPCLWSPAMPMLYRVRLELRRGGQVMSSVERTVGIRLLAARKKRLTFQGQNWILRGVDATICPAAGLESWRATRTVRLCHAIDDRLGAAASEQGILLAVDLAAAADWKAELKRLGRHAAVGAVILPAEAASATDDVRPLAPGLLIAQHLPPACDVWAIGVSALVLDVNEPADFAARAAALPLAVFARRRLAPAMNLDLATARLACDRLQADLAPWGDRAGYLV